MTKQLELKYFDRDIDDSNLWVVEINFKYYLFTSIEPNAIQSGWWAYCL